MVERATMRKSHASASDRPAPATAPRTAAMVGLGSTCSRRDASMRRRSERTRCSVLISRPLPSAMSLTSPPTQNAGPSPRSSTAPMAALSPAARSACSSRSHNDALSALRRSGRFSARMRKAPSVLSSSTSSITVSFVRIPCAARASHIGGERRPPVGQRLTAPPRHVNRLCRLLRAEAPQPASLMKAIAAPSGSSAIAKRPMLGMSLGSISTLPPSALARLAVASQSATAT